MPVRKLVSKSKKAPRPAASAEDLFPVAGVGASAGGLEALTAFLKALPAQTGMAFVVIQHLAPQQKSALTQLLSRVTAMPVVEASDGTAMGRNRVYVIQPGKSMTIRGGILRVAPRDRTTVPYHPIDEFFVALAKDRETASIAVILSGSGSDGTLGLKAIKEAGGVTFAQDPKTAAWADMPSNAIAAGAADFVMSPAGIAAELARISRHPYMRDRARTPVDPLVDEAQAGSDAMEQVHRLLRSATGVDYRLYKQPTLRRRIERRMALHKIKALADYARLLKQDAAETKALADDIFIHVTGFFRDPECFQALRKQVFPKLLPDRRTRPIRVWIPGCSTGEEVYSIAMLLLEATSGRAAQIGIQIFGTDISESAVDRARAGIYPEAAVRGVSRARLGRFFLKVEHGYQINKEVRGLCVFARHDLANDPPFSKLDLISCRNVLIYAGSLLQNRILSAFQYALNPGGFLFLGHSESISAYADYFAEEDRGYKIFSRKAKAGQPPDYHWGEDSTAPAGAPARTASPVLAADFQKEAEQILLQRYVPPALVIDSDLRVLHLQGDLNPYLTLPAGPPTVQLLKLLSPELVVDLQRAISKAKQEGTAAATGVIRRGPGQRHNSVRLEVSPLRRGDVRKTEFLVVFKEVPAAEPPTKAAGRSPDRALEQELEATRQYLASLIREHERAQEISKAAHEEVLSSSEELQSTNEELETAKEELQSSNEELLTLNDELLHRNTDLAVLTSDLNNVLVSVEIPVVVLDGSLHIRRFTPMAGKLLKLIESDVGRPFSDMAGTLDVTDWDALFGEVMEQGRPLERDVRDRAGRWHSLRVRPYRATDNKVDGVIVIVLDTDVMRRELEETRDYAHALLENAAQCIVAADADGRIVLANAATEKTFGYQRAELLGQPLASIVSGGIPQGDQAEGCRKDGSRFPLELSLTAIDQAGVNLTVAFMTDVTKRRKLEELSETYRNEVRALAAQLITAQEEERRSVSRELHDGVCQKLASMALDVESLAAALPGPAATRKRLFTLRATAVQISEEARNLAYELHPSVLDDLGLVVSLRSLCDDFGKAERLKVKFAAGKLPDLIPQKLASGLYRIAQECLQNVAKHARASRLSMSLRERQGRLILSIEDDGVGFSTVAVKGKGGLGLVSIAERVRIMHGEVSIESEPGSGTKVLVTVPLEQVLP